MPRVDCESRRECAAIPPIPPLWGMDAWATDVLGILECEYTIRAAEHQCLAKLRREGVIR